MFLISWFYCSFKWVHVLFRFSARQIYLFLESMTSTTDAFFSSGLDTYSLTHLSLECPLAYYDCTLCTYSYSPWATYCNNRRLFKHFILQLMYSSCVEAVQCRTVLHHCVVIFFWSSGINDYMFLTLRSAHNLKATLMWHYS